MVRLAEEQSFGVVFADGSDEAVGEDRHVDALRHVLICERVDEESPEPRVRGNHGVSCGCTPHRNRL